MQNEDKKSNKSFKTMVLNIPLIGKLIGWLYMIVMGPRKINEMQAQIELLKDEQEVSNNKPSCGQDWDTYYEFPVTAECLHGNVLNHRDFVDVIINYADRCSVGRCPKLIEVGIGTATMSIYLSKNFSYEVVGLDYDPRIIQKAIKSNEELGGYAKYICVDAFEIPSFLKPDSFDVAFSQGTMEHFDNEQLRKLIDAQLYIAKHVIFSVPSDHYPQEDFGNERRMSKEQWISLLKNLGFNAEIVDYYQENQHVYCVIQRD